MDIDSLIEDFATRIRSPEPMPIVHKAFGSRPLGLIVNSGPPEIVQPALPAVRVQRIEELLQQAARNALSRIDRLSKTRPMVDAFEQAVERQCAIILEAASKKDPLRRAEEYRKKLQAENKETRKALAADLKHARARLRELTVQIQTTEAQVARAQAMLSYQGRSYPDVPPAVLTPNKEGLGLPAEPGIYFLWQGETVVYVGRSKCLCRRVTLGSHHVLRPTFRISYVLIPERELSWAECYYIGTLRSSLNFGSMASHIRAKNEHPI